MIVFMTLREKKEHIKTTYYILHTGGRRIRNWRGYEDGRKRRVIKTVNIKRGRYLHFHCLTRELDTLPYPLHLGLYIGTSSIETTGRSRGQCKLLIRKRRIRLVNN